MPEIGNTYPTLIDLLKRTDPDNKIARIVEMLKKTNEIMEDAILVESNQSTSHISVIRTGYPKGTWRKIYGGVATEKSTTQQVTDTIGMLESYGEVDTTLADMNGNAAAFRLSETSGTLMGMNQTMAETLFYGDTDVSPQQFMGLAPRFSSLSTDKTKSGYNIIDAGGTGSANTEMYLIKWDPDGVFLTYPKGMMAGLQHEDKGQVTVIKSDNSKYEAYRDHYVWKLGLVVKNWQHVSRIANIDVPALKAGSVAIDDFLIDAYWKVRKVPGVAAIYCNVTVMTALHKRAKDKANVNLTIDTFGGKEVLKFLGMPVRLCDEIMENLARIV